MATATLTLTGTDAFAAWLAQLPPTVSTEARQLVHGAAQRTVVELHSAYPPRRAKSRSRFEPLQNVWFVTDKDADALHPRAEVAHREILAVWSEKGTKPRVTKKGWPRGRMPPAPVFVPLVVREQRQLRDALVALVRRQDLEVVDDGR